MKPVIIVTKTRFTKKEVIEAVLFRYEDVTTERELKRLIKRKHVLGFGKAWVDARADNGEDSFDETNDAAHQIAEEIGTELGLQQRLEEDESFMSPPDHEDHELDGQHHS